MVQSEANVGWTICREGVPWVIQCCVDPGPRRLAKPQSVNLTKQVRAFPVNICSNIMYIYMYIYMCACVFVCKRYHATSFSVEKLIKKLSTLKQETAIAISDRSWPRDLSCFTCPRRDPFPLSSAMAKSLAEASKCLCQDLSVLGCFAWFGVACCNDLHPFNMVQHPSPPRGCSTLQPHRRSPDSRRGRGTEATGLSHQPVQHLNDILVGAKLHLGKHHGSRWVFLVGGLAKHIACSSNGNPTRQTLKQLRQASWECTQLCKCINTEATPQGRPNLRQRIHQSQISWNLKEPLI